MSLIESRAGTKIVPILCVTRETWDARRASLAGPAAAFAQASGFEPRAGRHALLPDETGALGAVLFGLDPADTFAPGKLATLLPAGAYAFEGLEADAGEPASLSWLLSAYRFTRYKKPGGDTPQLVCPAGVDARRVQRMADGICLARDLINTPANDMSPVALEAAVHALAQRHGVTAKSVIGHELLARGFPLIHAVGRAAAEEPRLVDFSFGPEDAPKVTLVGKGVCFDTGGLDIKPSSAMLLMKKDMGGAAVALALAHMIMDAKLPIRLRVLVPIVENAVAADSFRPGDVYPSRKGLNVEIGNTDAEGRLILADALTLGAEEQPELLIDFATLTGAARVALGPDLPPFYTGDDAFAAEVQATGLRVHDPVWQLPLWDAYDSLLDSKTADINNVSNGPFAGSITAALFLRRFVEGAGAWAHFDVYGWNPSTKPGRPEGGEAQAARLLYDVLERRYRAA